MTRRLVNGRLTQIQSDIQSDIDYFRTKYGNNISNNISKRDVNWNGLHVQTRAMGNQSFCLMLICLWVLNYLSD